MSKTPPTFQELNVCEIARSFGEEDNFVISAASNSGIVGAVLAQELYAPKVSFYMGAKGKGAILRNVRYPFIVGKPPEGFIETLVDMQDVFDAVGGGKWCMIMQPVQLDKHGYMNLSLVGDINKPHRVFVGSRGVPDNTVNAPRIIYLVPSHNSKVFVENVDFKSGVGHGKERKEGLVKYGAPVKVLTNLCVMDFEEETGRMRLKSVHTGVTVDDVKNNTGFDLVIPDNVPETPAPSDDEMRYIREIIDPTGISRLDYLRGEEHKKVLDDIMGGTTYNHVYK